MKEIDNNKKSPEEKGSSRREMLKLGMLAGGVALLGGEAINLFGKTEEPSGEKVKALTTDGRLIEVCSDKLGKCTSSDGKIRKGVEGKKFVMVIDLARCENKRTCIEACQKMHNILPPTEYLKVKRMQDSKLAKPYWFPTHCHHCDNPPCIKVCPVDATFKRSDGLVGIDPERCVGCKFCMAACPYSARVFNFGKPAQVAYTEKHKNDKGVCGGSCSNPVGTVSKCDMCPETLAQGKLPVCVTECPNGTMFVGDENEDTVTNGDEVFRLSELLGSRAAYRQFETLGTEPRVYYLPPDKRIFPFEEAHEKHNTKE